jgi:hypothetical protein
MQELNGKKKEIINNNLVLNEAGILVEPDFLLAKGENKTTFADTDAKIASHNKERRRELRAPIPGVKVPFSMVMVKAVRPKMINTLAEMNLINIDIEGDERFKREAVTMVRVILDEQEIVSVGKNAEENFAVGELVKIDFRRFTALRDTNVAVPDGQYSKEIDVPICTINGHEYIIIDQRDIRWTFDRNHQLDDLIGFEDEIV